MPKAEKEEKVKEEKSREEILEELRFAESEEGRTGLVDKFLKDERK